MAQSLILSKKLKKTLEQDGIVMEVAEIAMVAQNKVPVDELDMAKKIITLMEDFEDHDDVQNTYANFDISENVVSQLNVD